MRVVPVPNLKDNYAYLVIDEASNQAAIVDPGEAAPIARAAAAEGVKLVAVWATHHHPDHVGGVPELVQATPGLTVVCHTLDLERRRVPGATRGVDEGDVVELGPIRARIIHNPGHTLGAISYWIEADPTVFTGDTLFGAGCGRVFEGDAEMMHASLSKLAKLPPETRVYFGHEYTVSNLKFARAAEPDTAEIAARAARVDAQRAAGEPSTPSTMGDERATNPFLRARDAAEFGRLRAWKDRF